MSAVMDTQSLMSSNIEKWSHKVIYSTFSFMVMQWLLTEQFTQSRHITHYSHSIHKTIYICMYTFLPLSRKKVSRHFLQQSWSQITDCCSLACHQNVSCFKRVWTIPHTVCYFKWSSLWAANYQKSLPVAAIFQLQWPSDCVSRQVLKLGLHCPPSRPFFKQEPLERWLSRVCF